jgi:hypothetical protein
VWLYKVTDTGFPFELRLLGMGVTSGVVAIWEVVLAAESLWAGVEGVEEACGDGWGLLICSALGPAVLLISTTLHVWLYH